MGTDIRALFQGQVNNVEYLHSSACSCPDSLSDTMATLKNAPTNMESPSASDQAPARWHKKRERADEHMEQETNFPYCTLLRIFPSLYRACEWRQAVRAVGFIDWWCVLSPKRRSSMIRVSGHRASESGVLCPPLHFLGGTQTCAVSQTCVCPGDVQLTYLRAKPLRTLCRILCR